MGSERKGRRMITKTYARDEIMSFGNLRNLSQKDALALFEKQTKIGLLIKDELKLAIVDSRDLERLIEENEYYRSLLEDHEIYKIVQERLPGVHNPEVWKEVPENEEEFIKMARKSAGLE